MCVYCNCGDNFFLHDPPFDLKDWLPPSFEPVRPLIPLPVDPTKPIIPWDLAKLRAYRDILEEIKELEERLGCPCEPNKADYIALLEARIMDLKNRIPPPGSPESM